MKEASCGSGTTDGNDRNTAELRSSWRRNPKHRLTDLPSAELQDGSGQRRSLSHTGGAERKLPEKLNIESGQG